MLHKASGTNGRSRGEQDLTPALESRIKRDNSLLMASKEVETSEEAPAPVTEAGAAAEEASRQRESVEAPRLILLCRQ